MTRLRPTPALLLLATLACGHSEPFEVSEPRLEAPLFPGEPARLTYSDAPDRDPAWTPDGSSVIYAGASFLSGGIGTCLTMLPAAGGSVERQFCDSREDGLRGAHSTPAVSSDLRVAFSHEAFSELGQRVIGGVYVAPLSVPLISTLTRPLGFEVSGAFYAEISALRWLGTSELVFLGMAEAFVPCPTGCRDELRVVYGRDILRASVGSPASVVPVPGTARATSVTVGETADVLYYTLMSDSRVYRHRLSTGELASVHDFGAAGIARDLHFAAGRLAAIVGGKLKVYSTAAEPLPFQGSDEGGHLHVVDLGTGESHELGPATRWYHRPALSPDGSRLVAEGYEVQIVETGPGVLDTLVDPASDLWSFGAP